MLLGQEETAPRFHVAAVGVSQRIDWRSSAEQAAASAHAQGGVAIAAHPDKTTWGVIDHAALRAIDGVEIGAPVPSDEDPWDGGWVRQFFETAASLAEKGDPVGPKGCRDPAVYEVDDEKPGSRLRNAPDIGGLIQNSSVVAHTSGR